LEKVLVTGVVGGLGGLGRLVARALQGRHRVTGVDSERWRRSPPGISLHTVDLRKRKFEDVIRTERPKAVVHLGFIRHFRVDDRERHQVNVGGTRILIDHCVKYGVERLVVLSSGYVYGAFPENPYQLTEEALLSGSRSYPEIRDLVEVDGLVSSTIWRRPELTTSVLRPVNVLGPTVSSMVRSYLMQARVPTVLGFNPMMQFIHEEDMANAVVLAVDHQLRGVYNVVGPGEVPVHTAIEETGGRAWPIPDPAARFLFARFFRLGLIPYPAGLLDFLKYPVSLAGERFAAATGFRCKYGLPEIFESVRR
jgi:UDP-glucose 4-epimerase